MNFFPNSLEIWNQTWNVKVEVHKICMACFVLERNIRPTDVNCEINLFSLPVHSWHHLSAQHTSSWKLCSRGSVFMAGLFFFFSPETQSEVRRLIKLLFISVFLCFIFYININLWEIVNKIYSEEKLTSIPNTYMFKHC